MFFYCPKTGGFYSPEVHGEQMPAESELWPLTDEEYEALLDAQGQGLLIVAGKDGQPVATPPPPLGDEALATIERDWRDRQLDDTDAWSHVTATSSRLVPRRSALSSTRRCRRTAANCATGRSLVSFRSQNTGRPHRTGSKPSSQMASCSFTPYKLPASPLRRARGSLCSVIQPLHRHTPWPLTNIITVSGPRDQ